MATTTVHPESRPTLESICTFVGLGFRGIQTPQPLPCAFRNLLGLATVIAEFVLQTQFAPRHNSALHPSDTVPRTDLVISQVPRGLPSMASATFRIMRHATSIFAVLGLSKARQIHVGSIKAGFDPGAIDLLVRPRCQICRNPHT